MPGGLDEGGQPGDSIQLVLSSDGVLPDGQPIGVGTWVSHGSRQEAAPPLAQQPLQVASDPSWQQVQCGDAITETTFTAVHGGFFGAANPAQAFWSVDAGPWLAGLPPGMSLAEEGCIEAEAGMSCLWRLSGQANVPTGKYVVELHLEAGAQTGAAQTTIVGLRKSARCR